MATRARVTSLDPDMLLMQCDKAIAAAEYAHATWQQRVDEQRRSSRPSDHSGQGSLEKDRTISGSQANTDVSLGIPGSIKTKSRRSSEEIKERERENCGDHENEKEREGKGQEMAVLAFSEGVAAMEEGEFGRAVLYFKEAASNCPSDKQAAMEKIERCLANVLEKLREHEVRAREGISEPNLEEEIGHRQKVHPQFGKIGSQTTETGQESNLSSVLSRSKVAAAEVANVKVADSGDLSPPSILHEPDAEMADNFFRAGVKALEEGSLTIALEHLKAAALKCPPEKRTAANKIQKLIAEVKAELSN